MGKIEKALDALEGVEKSKVNFKKKTAVITMKAGKTLSEETVVKAITEAGFKASNFKEKAAAQAKPEKKKAAPEQPNDSAK